MIRRRIFTSCALCFVGGLTADVADAQTPAAAGGVTRKILSDTDMPGGKLHCVLVMAEIEAAATVARHTHPGIESVYVVEGGGVLSAKGHNDRTFKESDSWQLEAEVPHSLVNGAKKTRLLITYTVDKDKPLASPAPAD